MEAKAEMREEKGKMRNTKQRKEDTGGGQIARDSQAARDAERERERERERWTERERHLEKTEYRGEEGCERCRVGEWRQTGEQGRVEEPRDTEAQTQMGTEKMAEALLQGKEQPRRFPRPYWSCLLARPRFRSEALGLPPFHLGH
jgi:hypothetical protein